MRAALCETYGPPESLKVVDVADPTVGKGQVKVDIAFAAVNFPDALMMQNKYQVSIPAPFIPGSEFSGVVSEVGEGVSRVKVGDHVFGSHLMGAYAEQIVVSEFQLHVIDDSVPLDKAAAFWVAHATSYHALRSVAEVQPGEKVLVLGAAGGVGLSSVEIATLLGAEVIAVASTDEKLEVCRQYGAQHLINSSRVELRAHLKEAFPKGIDVVIDPVGGELSEKALRAVKFGGRFIVVGFASGEIPRIPLNLILLKGSIIKGIEVRTFAFNSPRESERDQREMLQLLTEGKLSPNISSVYPLAQARDALLEVSQRRAQGKVVISMK